MTADALPPIGARVAVPCRRGNTPGYVRLTVTAYTVAGLGAVSHRAAATWHAEDSAADTPAARVWGILTTDGGADAGQYRAARLCQAAKLAAELDALELAVTADLAALDAGASL